MKKAFVFRGAPSSGKGTITKQFVHSLPSRAALLELDTFRWSFHLTNRDVKEVTDDEHRFAYHNLLMMLESYCRYGQYDLVVEGLFGWATDSPHGNIQDIISILEHYKFEYTLFVLTGSREVLWDRNTKREYVVPREEFDQLYDTVSNTINEREIKIDVESLSVDECVSFALSKTGMK